MAISRRSSWAADGTELSRVVRRAPQGCLRPIPLRGSLSTSGVVSAAGGAWSRHEGLADAMDTIRDVAPAASSGTLAGVVGYGWRVGRAVAWIAALNEKTRARYRPPSSFFAWRPKLRPSYPATTSKFGPCLNLRCLERPCEVL